MSASPFSLKAERSLFREDEFEDVNALPGEDELSHLASDLDITTYPSVRIPRTTDEQVLIVKPKVLRNVSSHDIALRNPALKGCVAARSTRISTVL